MGGMGSLDGSRADVPFYWVKWLFRIGEGLMHFSGWDGVGRVWGRVGSEGS